MSCHKTPFYLSCFSLHVSAKSQPLIRLPQHFFISSKPPHSIMGKLAFHYVFLWLICASSQRAKPPCINARFWKPGSLLYGVSFNTKIAPSNNNCLAASFSESALIFSSLTFLCFLVSVFQHIPPILRHSELLLSSHEFNNELHAWVSPGWITCLQYFSITSLSSCRFG